MRTFRLIPDFSAHVLHSIEEDIGHVSQRKIGCIQDKEEDYLATVLQQTTETLQTTLRVPVYKKQNQCLTSNNVTLAVYWESVWIYLIFYKKKNRIYVVGMYRKKMMDEVHYVQDQNIGVFTTDI
jgi:hypothetical protein